MWVLQLQVQTPEISSGRWVFPVYSTSRLLSTDESAREKVAMTFQQDARDLIGQEFGCSCIKRSARVCFSSLLTAASQICRNHGHSSVTIYYILSHLHCTRSTQNSVQISMLFLMVIASILSQPPLISVSRASWARLWSPVFSCPCWLFLQLICPITFLTHADVWPP